MEFLGFTNNDFDFFKKKSMMDKAEYNERREEVKRHFRELCYQIQKNYHSLTGGTLLLDKDFHGLAKNKAYIYAFSKMDDADVFGLYIMLGKDSLNINLCCPYDGNPVKFQELKGIINDNKDKFAKFFKENKNMHIELFSRNYKKQGEDGWTEEFKYTNNELNQGDYNNLIKNMEKLQPDPLDDKNLAGLRICTIVSKPDAIKLGNALSLKLCKDIIRLIKLCGDIF